jgi:cation transport protein ChaC
VVDFVKGLVMDSTAASRNPAFTSARLTSGLVAVIARKLDDRGPAPGVVVHNDDDYEASLQSLLAAGAWQEGQDVWVFGYGSLLWKPCFEVVEQISAVLPGWHRAFCIRLTRFRGTPEEPGLMMSLVPGGSCRGSLLRVARERVVDDLRKLWRREMTVKPPNTPPRWIKAKTAHGLVPAIVFAADRKGPNYVSGLTEDDIAGILCRAAGHWGSGAEYLLETVDQLEQLGIRDARLWRLQKCVAQNLMALQTSKAIGHLN